MINKTETIVKFWGICDLSFIVIYVATSIIGGRLPVYSDIVAIFTNAESYGSDYIKIFSIVSVILYVSIAYSGWLLWKRDKLGGLIAYIQTPIRIATITPSLYFIFWPLKYISHIIVSVIIMWILLLLTEGIKVYNITQWRKHIVNAG